MTPNARQSPDDHGEQEHAAAELQALVLQIPEIVDAHDHNYELGTAEGSDMAGDNQATHPHDLVTHVQTCLNLAADGLRAIHHLLITPTGLQLPQSAHYPLIRSVLEASSQALWLLSPDDRRERVRRLLQVLSSESAHDEGLSKAMAIADPGDQRAERSMKNGYMRNFSKTHRANSVTIRAVATAFNLTGPDYQVGRLSYSWIVREAAVAIGEKPSLVTATWHIVSGLTHPSTSRTSMMSVVDTISDSGEESDLLKVRMSSDVRLVFASLVIATRFQAAAEVLLRERNGTLPTGT